MPNVVIIEKARQHDLKRISKPDVTRAMYSVSTPIAHPAKRGPAETRLVVDRESYLKSYFMCEASIDDQIMKASDR